MDAGRVDSVRSAILNDSRRWHGAVGPRREAFPELAARLFPALSLEQFFWTLQTDDIAVVRASLEGSSGCHAAAPGDIEVASMLQDLFPTEAATAIAYAPDGEARPPETLPPFISTPTRIPRSTAHPRTNEARPPPSSSSSAVGMPRPSSTLDTLVALAAGVPFEDVFAHSADTSRPSAAALVDSRQQRDFECGDTPSGDIDEETLSLIDEMLALEFHEADVDITGAGDAPSGEAELANALAMIEAYGGDTETERSDTSHDEAVARALDALENEAGRRVAATASMGRSSRGPASSASATAAATQLLSRLRVKGRPVGAAAAPTPAASRQATFAAASTARLMSSPAVSRLASSLACVCGAAAQGHGWHTRQCSNASYQSARAEAEELRGDMERLRGRMREAWRGAVSREARGGVLAYYSDQLRALERRKAAADRTASLALLMLRNPDLASALQGGRAAGSRGVGGSGSGVCAAPPQPQGAPVMRLGHGGLGSGVLQPTDADTEAAPSSSPSSSSSSACSFSSSSRGRSLSELGLDHGSTHGGASTRGLAALDSFPPVGCDPQAWESVTDYRGGTGGGGSSSSSSSVRSKGWAAVATSSAGGNGAPSLPHPAPSSASVRPSLGGARSLVAQVDLHGQHGDEAVSLLEALLPQYAAEGVATVHVITGKGGGPGGHAPMKQRVAAWLLRTAGPGGGGGAVRIRGTEPLPGNGGFVVRL